MMQKSTLWRHFTKLTSEKKVTCLYCPQQLSVANKSTCSLIRHLKAKHPEVEIWLKPGSEGQSYQEEVLLVNNDDVEEHSEIQEEPVLEYELVEELIESETEEENNEIDQKPILNTVRSNNTKEKVKSTEQQVISAMVEARRQIGDALLTMKSLKRPVESEDEYDHFGHVIASKIRKIHDVDERERVMHSIYNKVYEALAKQV